MVDRPIIFSAPMVCALIDGRKTMTRRVLKPQPPYERGDDFEASLKWRAGDRLWVREAHAFDSAGRPLYRTDFSDTNPMRWRPSIHMPRWASRITLDVTAVRVERVQEISEADARDEGIEPEPVRVFDAPHTPPDREARPAFSRLWDSLYGAGAWDANPWVVVISFDVRKGNIDG